MTLEPEEVIWHDAECGGYAGDFELWERLCAERGAPVLELGAGTGRLAMHLARRGHEVVAVEVRPALAAALGRRAAEEDLPVEVIVANALELDLGRAFRLVLAPMQFVQLFLASDERVALLARCRGHLAPGGAAAVAIVDGIPDGMLSGEAEPGDAIPDVREVDGVVYASEPLASAVREGVIESKRRRQRVSRQGEIAESRHVDRLAVLESGSLEAEAGRAGLRAVGEEPIAPTDLHVGSRAVLFESAP